MTSILKYRSIVVSFVLVFSLFNIGLPIVIASCPMLKFGRAMACCLMDDVPNSVRLTTHNDTSCCNTVIAAERNTNEFVQAKVFAHEPVLQVEVIPDAFVATGSPSFVLNIFLTSSSPPTVVDIPILTSSLLI